MEPGLQLKLLMLGLWLLVVYRSAKPFILAIKSTHWNKAYATITTSSFDRDNSIYTPKIIYKYTVNGRDFMNDTYTYFGVSSFTKSNVIKIAESHPEGTSVEIFTNPDNPRESVIIPGVHWGQ